MIIIDLETMGVDSTSVVLSFGATYITEVTDDYQKMLDSSIFVKFRIDEQFALGRTSDPGTCTWWDRQAEQVKVASLYPNPEKDVAVVRGCQLIREWLKGKLSNDESVFARGALDSMVLDSLCRTFDIPQIVSYNKFYDVRTAIDFTYDLAKNGYVDVEHPTFDTSMVLKHHPVHDTAYDGMMLIYGKK
jgi:hypothetical protein